MSRRQISAQAGATMVEMLLALPVVLLLGLGIAQFTLVYQAKHALDYALTQAARQGAVEHASAASIERGLAAGLVPYLYGAGDWAGLDPASPALAVAPELRRLGGACDGRDGRADSGPRRDRQR